jgi:hypothetical protein
MVKAKFEEDKARKEKHGNPTPWSAEIWQAARAARNAGVVEPEKRFPVIITTGSTGPFISRQKLQEVAGLPSLPEVQWATVTTIFDDEEEREAEEAEEEVGAKQGSTGTTTITDAQTAQQQQQQKKKKQQEQKEEPKKVQYCHVNWEQLQRVKEYSDGEDVMVWFQDCKRFAWVARLLKGEG